MRSIIFGALLVPALALPAFASCEPVDDPVIGIEWNCGAIAWFGASSVASAAPGGGGCESMRADCAPQTQAVQRDGGVNGSDALGFGAAATALGVAAMSGNPAAVAAAAMGVGAAAAGPVGDAAASGAVGDAAAASDGAGTGD